MPAPVVDEESERGVSRGCRCGRYTVDLSVAAILTSHRVGGGLLRRGFADGPEDFCFLVTERIGVVVGGRFHRCEREELQQMALEHVAEDAGVFVVAAAVAYVEVFENGDLDVIDVVAVPERLEDGVAKAKYDEVLDGVFAEVVIDAEELVLVGAGVDGVVEITSGVEVCTEGFFDD